MINVNELGNQISPGQLEITESDLVFHQRKRPHVRWPLRSLRRYGYDSEIFSFECGRRCPTGPGIYAFRCSRAERLFEHLQSHIQVNFAFIYFFIISKIVYKLIFNMNIGLHEFWIEIRY